MAGKNNIVPSSNNNPSSDNKKKGMYKSIKIEGFRQFDKFEINDLGAINLFLGENNSGKSSILEAVYTHACGLNFNNFNQKIIYGRRFNSPNGIFDAFDRIRALFYSIESHPYKFIISMGRDILVSPDNDKREDDFITESFDEFEYIFKPSSFISLVDPRAEGYIDSSFLENEATDRSLGSFEIIDTSRSRGLKIDYKYPRFSIDNKHPQSYPAIFHNILDHRFTGTDLNVFSHLKRYNMLDNFIEEIKEAFPIIKDIDYIPYPDDNKAPVSITIEDGKQLPLYVFGDGLRRWFHILGYMTIFKNAVHCIEEIDSAFHPESQKLLAPLLLRYSKKYHNQIMLTSHSLEFADLFLASLYKDEHNELIEGEEDPVRIFTLKRDENNKLELWKRTGKKAFEMRSKFGMELRQMFSMIICEGKTDAILMSYFLYKKYGVTFSKSNPPIRLPIEPQNQIIEWYSKKENSKPSIAIWGVGGVDMIKAALSDVLEINKEEANKELRFDKIVIYFDTDDREQKDNDELFRRWLEYAGFDNDEKDEAKLGNWFKRSITLAGSNTNKFFIDIFGLALPPDGKGALETFLLDCLKKRSGEDKDIVEGAREYIDKLKEVSYLNKRRFPEKAALGSVLSVLSPDWIFTVMDEKLKSIEWEKITDFLDSYQKLGRLVSVE